MGCNQGWGEAPWGSGPWGGGPGAGPLQIASVLAVSENLIRVEFTVPIYFTGLLVPSDAALPSNWAVEPQTQTTGQNGEPCRPVTVVAVARPPLADVPALDNPRYVDLTIDRPMTPFPAVYALRIVGAIFTADLSFCLEDAGTYFPGIYRVLQEPSLQPEVGSRDFANAQTGADALANLTNADSSRLNLGTYQVGADGDYAFDEGVSNYRKRIVRRIVTRTGGFSWLPNYGADVPAYGKRLGQASVLTGIVTDVQKQIMLEPDTSKARVIPDLTNLPNGLFKLVIIAKMRTGESKSFTIPIPIS